MIQDLVLLTDTLIDLKDLLLNLLQISFKLVLAGIDLVIGPVEILVEALLGLRYIFIAPSSLFPDHEVLKLLYRFF